MKLLVAEDERWIRKGILKMIDLEELAFEEVLEAATLDEYEKIFLEKWPEIVISDVRFPNGISCPLCQKLYDLQPRTRFIMLSGYQDFEYVKAALGYKAVDYLLKPVDKKVLNDTIRRAVSECVQAEKGEGIRDFSADFLEQTAGTGEQIIRRLMEDIRRDCAKKYTLSEAAKKYHISEAYLSSLFARTAGVSFITYIMELRVSRAKDLLLQTEQKINDIAEAVGYEDTRYFAKVFKKVAGESPTEYRLRQRRELDEENRSVTEPADKKADGSDRGTER